jgi:hypothetical protein
MATKKTTRKTPEPTLRHVWLAGLGLIAVARREAVAAANEAADRLQVARAQAESFAGQAQRDVLGRLADVREQGEARVGRFSAEVETRLQPVLTKLGLKQPARKAAPRARKKPAAMRTRATPVRKPLAKRPARRSRA